MKGLTVSQAAEATGLSTTALRYYEQAGVVPPVARDSAGRRVFTEADLAWVEYAVCLRSLGMGVAEIARYVEAAHRPDGRAEQLELLQRHLQRMQAQRTTLDSYIAVARAKLAANGVQA